MDTIKITPDKIKQNLTASTIVNSILCLDEVDSTNEYLKRNAEQFSHGTLTIAEAQNKGKGSKGRSWDSPAGSGIWMSLLLKPDIHMQKAPMLTLVMAVSVARACNKLYKIPVLIKWPNDIVCHGKKLCGILTEMKNNLNVGYCVIIGMGINVNVRQFPEEIAKTANSIFLETGATQDRSLLIAEIMNCFSKDYAIFLEQGDLSGLLRTYSSLSATIGQPVRVLDAQGEYTAMAISVSREGHLLVEKEDKCLVQVFADEVSVRGIYGYAPGSSEGSG